MSTTLLERDPAPTGVPMPSHGFNETSAPVIIAFGLVYVVCGIDVSGDSRGSNRSRHSCWPVLVIADRFHSVPYPALEDRRAADSGTVAYVLHYGFLTVVRWTAAFAWPNVRFLWESRRCFVATVSLWMVLIDWLRPEARDPERACGWLLLGLAGLALLVGLKTGGSSRGRSHWSWASVVASLAWAAGSVYSKHAGGLSGSPLMERRCMCLAGGVSLWIAGIVSGELAVLHLRAVSARSWARLDI